MTLKMNKVFSKFKTQNNRKIIIDRNHKKNINQLLTSQKM